VERDGHQYHGGQRERQSAQAQVEIRLKNSPPDGASMKLSYNLEKRGEEWAVVKSQPAGGTMQHPAPGEMPAGGCRQGIRT